MSIQTNIKFLNANDPEFIAAKNGTPEEREEWEDINGSVEDRPGADLGDFDNNSIEHTEDEYGGWVIDLSKVPSEATHVVIFRA